MLHLQRAISTRRCSILRRILIPSIVPGKINTPQRKMKQTFMKAKDVARNLGYENAVMGKWGVFLSDKIEK